MAALKPPQPTIVEKALATPTSEQIEKLAFRNECFDLIFQRKKYQF